MGFFFGGKDIGLAVKLLGRTHFVWVGGEDGLSDGGGVRNGGWWGAGVGLVGLGFRYFNNFNFNDY